MEINNAFTIEYIFNLDHSVTERFQFIIDGKTLDAIHTDAQRYPDWTRLENNKCPNCSLSEKIQFCPVAQSLAVITARFDKIISYTEIDLQVKTAERTIIQKTSAQSALSSMIGLAMATSGCPHTKFFKPMANFHLPLSSDTETFYRAASMYLLAQYFIKRENGSADLELSGLAEIYNNLRIINHHTIERIKRETSADSSVNALVHLDMFALSMPMIIEDSLEEIKYLFTPYLD